MLEDGNEHFLDLYGNEIADVKRLYPEFDTWFTQKVAPGLKAGTRLLRIARIDRDFGGFVIAKKEGTERKLCTLWVAENCRGKGLANSLLETACHWLGTRKPLASARLGSSSRTLDFLERHGFEPTSRITDPKTGLTDIFYNET